MPRAVAEPKQDERYVLALEQARRNLDRQADDLKDIRGRATTILGVAALSITLIGGLALRDKGELRWTSYAALFVFTLVALLALFITFPRTFAFAYDADGMLKWIKEEQASINRMTRQLAIHLQKNYRCNRKAMESMRRLYSFAVVALIIEIALLLLDLRGR
jgi:hypothetical protein